MYSYIVDINSFYKDFNGADFSKVQPDRIAEIANKVEKVNSRRINCSCSLYKGARKYTNIMNHVRMNPKFYDLRSKEEVYFLFMFCVDPEFEAFMIVNEYNTMKEIKEKLLTRFGFPDTNLPKIEKEFIKNFMKKEEREKIKEEIDKRIWK